MLKILAVTNLPTSFGIFKLIAIKNGQELLLALVKGKVAGKENVSVRLHSACITSETFGSIKCECKQQLDWALSHISHSKAGIVIYLPQEGRGIGIVNKIKTYALQEKGLNTIDANLALGFPVDSRRYYSAAQVLKLLDVKSISLMTNNPDKVSALKNEGVKVETIINIEIDPVSQWCKEYLETKKNKMGHYLNKYI